MSWQSGVNYDLIYNYCVAVVFCVCAVVHIHVNTVRAFTLAGLCASSHREKKMVRNLKSQFSAGAKKILVLPHEP